MLSRESLGQDSEISERSTVLYAEQLSYKVIAHPFGRQAALEQHEAVWQLTSASADPRRRKG